MSYLETQAPENMVKQRKNKLKGMAMEYAITKLMSKTEGSEDRLDDILQEAQEYLTDVYTVKKMFRIWDEDGKTTFRRQVREFGTDHRLAFDKQDLEGKVFDIKSPDSSDNVKLGYKKCSHCDYKYPPVFCKNCGGAYVEERYWILKKISENWKHDIDSDKDNSRYTTVSEDNKSDQFLSKINSIKKAKWNKEGKWGPNEFCNCEKPRKEEHFFNKHRKCRKCKQGYFSFVKTEFSKTDWRIKKRNACFEEARDYLLENGYISESTFADKIKSKRVDTWSYDGERIQIFESKNKEKTGLNYSNIAQAFYYIKALRKAGLTTTKDAWIIYNGEMPENLVKSINHYQSVYGYSISPISLKNWCAEKGIYIEKIIIGDKIDGERISENGDYKANLITSEKPVQSPSLIVRD